MGRQNSALPSGALRLAGFEFDNQRVSNHLHGGAVETFQLALQLAIVLFLMRSAAAALLTRNPDSALGHALAFIF